MVAAFDANPTVVQAYNELHKPKCAKVSSLGAPNTAKWLAESGTNGMVLGAPCQPYGKSGSGLGPRDRRCAFVQLLQCIHWAQLQWVVVECAPTIPQHDGGNTLRDLVQALRLLGYAITWRVTELARLRPIRSRRWTATILQLPLYHKLHTSCKLHLLQRDFQCPPITPTPAELHLAQLHYIPLELRI